jgi:hypothetical protein
MHNRSPSYKAARWARGIPALPAPVLVASRRVSRGKEVDAAGVAVLTRPTPREFRSRRANPLVSWVGVVWVSWRHLPPRATTWVGGGFAERERRAGGRHDATRVEVRCLISVCLSSRPTGTAAGAVVTTYNTGSASASPRMVRDDKLELEN